MGHLDARTTTTRRLRRGMALAACTALLGLTACGAGDEAGTGDGGAQEPATATEEQSGEEQPSDDAGSGADAGDESADEAGDAAGAGAPEAGEPGAAGKRTRILLVTDLGIDETSGDGAPTLANDDLAALLAEPFGGTAECADELVVELGQRAGGGGPPRPAATAPPPAWVASTVAVPHEDGLESGYRVAVLFSTGTELPEEASELTQENVMLTGLGQGSMFGAEPLGAEEVAEATLQTLTSENAYVPVAGMADWSEVTCEDGLDFAEFGTTDCTAATAEGDSWQLHVAPGAFADGDQGLLVGIGSPADV